MTENEVQGERCTARIYINIYKEKEETVMEKLIILYHGTKYKYAAKAITRYGFESYTFFARHLEDAIHMGGKHVFEVVFREDELPDNWQVRCTNKIPQTRIVGLTTYTHEELDTNKKLCDLIFSHAMEEPSQPDYMFTEENNQFLSTLKEI